MPAPTSSWGHPAPPDPSLNAAAALERLGRLPVREQTLRALLQAVVDLTPTVLPGQIEASVTVLTGGRPTTAASSGPLADDLDQCQYAAGDGPCLHAARTGQITDVADTPTDRRWPTYARRAAERGALASLSLPLGRDTEDQPGVSLNIYARRGYSFAPANRAAAVRLAGLAGLAARYLAALHHAGDRTDHPGAGRDGEAAVERATGILMERHRLTAEQALRSLTRLSEATRRTVRDLAGDLVRTGELPDGGGHAGGRPVHRPRAAGRTGEGTS